ncbi:hypothetical protein FACS1894151_03530 [Spirochaetia bacterium]|nr:hypothetical protein FACS1894151_03530 [Spirochaetia bacterium]
MNKTDIKNALPLPKNIVNDIAFTMDMEGMPLSEQEKQHLRPNRP